VDIGTIAALRLLDPDNTIPACVVSCNVYSDRAETVVLGKAARDAVARLGRRAVAVGVTALSDRMFTEWIDPAADRIHSLKDDEWNRKILELLAAGRIEDVAQLAREFTRQANGDSKLKAVWWLAAVMGQHNRYAGSVRAYEALWGTGAAVVGLVPSEARVGDLEYDEDDLESFRGERGVLAQ
jgi:2-aminophenol/2-amino-5-chlorophenol 1,6-dioxygenase alpha subunit